MTSIADYGAYIQMQHAKYVQCKWHFTLKNGFTWGDFAVFTFTELMEMAKERHENEKSKKEKEKEKEKEKQKKTTVNSFELARQQYLEENPEPLCAACNTFQIHSNPPSDWAKSDYIYCCLQCRNTEGKGHGDRCKKCLPPKKIKNTSYCLDCEY
jgi:hypothetical protein